MQFSLTQFMLFLRALFCNASILLFMFIMIPGLEKVFASLHSWEVKAFVNYLIILDRTCSGT